MNTSPNENITDKVPELPEDNTPRTKKLVRELFDWVEIFVVTISVILLVFTFFVRIAYVDGGSMNNTLYDGETLIVSNLFYTPKQGDIVVFQSPDSKKVDGALVKRVIATEGQEIYIDFDMWRVVVDGVELDEPYVNYEIGSMDKLDFDRFTTYTVPEGHVFVMGDNRNNSTDSRDLDIGFVDTRFIFGRVLFRVTPLNKLGPVK